MELIAGHIHKRVIEFDSYAFAFYHVFGYIEIGWKALFT